MTENLGDDLAPTPPGWYPDPKMAGTQRYWDGERWTDDVAPLAHAAPPSHGPSVWTIARGVALGIAAVVAGLIFLAQCQQENAEQEYLDCLMDAIDKPYNHCVDPSPNN